MVKRIRPYRTGSDEVLIQKETRNEPIIQGWLKLMYSEHVL